MSGLYGILDMCKWATLAQQANIGVVGHNISNVNTPGYSRQKVILEAAHPITTGVGQMGTGVKAVGVERDYDRLIGMQLNFEKQLLGNWQALDYGFSRVETIFNEPSEYGLGAAMDQFWNAWQALADNPSGQAERISLVSTAAAMASDFNKKYEDLRTLQQDSNESIRETVDLINSLAERIVELNEKIAAVEITGDSANDFRDQREALMDELAQKIGIDYLEDGSGQVSIFLEDGRPLLQNRMQWKLEVEVNTFNDNYYDVSWNDRSDTLLPLTGSIRRGELGGLIEMRDTIIPDYLHKLDRLAAGIMHEVNTLHYDGYGLDGSTEQNFFNPVTAAADRAEENTGEATVSGGDAYDPSVLTLDDYEIRFTDAGTFEIRNRTDGTQVMEARVNGTVESDGSFAYASGSDIEFEGIRIRITDGSSGPAGGDIFTVRGSGDAARTMAVNPLVAGDVNSIAAAEGPEGNDNRTALAIAALRDENHMNGRTGTFGGYYSGLVGEAGVDVQDASRSLTYRQSMVDHLNTRKESLSGVNLDEEAVNLLRYQHAFTASARMINVVDELIQELLNLV